MKGEWVSDHSLTFMVKVEFSAHQVRHIKDIADRVGWGSAVAFVRALYPNVSLKQGHDMALAIINDKGVNQ